MRCFLALILGLIVGVGPAVAQCQNGRCSFPANVQPTYVTVSPSPAVPFTWTYSADYAEAYLYRGDVQIGGYNYADAVYRTYVNGAWSEPTTAPVMIPADMRPAGPELVAAADNFGVDETRLRNGRNGETAYTHKGKRITRSEALDLVAADPQIPDDTGKLRVTVIGSAADRAGFVSAYKAADAADARSRTVLWEIPAEHWTVKEYGFVATGKPTVYVQSIDADGRGGKVLHRQNDYVAGDKSIDAIRRAIKSYDATKDADLRVAAVGPSISAEDLTAWFKKNTHFLVGVAAVAGAAYYRRTH